MSDADGRTVTRSRGGDRADAGERRGRRGLRARIGERSRRVLGPRALLLALVVTGAGLLVGRAVVPLFGGLGGLLGVFAGGFLLGLRGGSRRYLETGIAGSAVVGVATLVDYFALTLLGGIGLPVAALGAGAGFLAAALGYYFGRDLRAGVTREL